MQVDRPNCLRGELKGHNGWVTSIATSPEAPDMLVSGSRDKTIIKWHLSREDGAYTGAAVRRLKGHSHFVQDIAISSDGQFVLSGSWDGTLRLWDLNQGTTTRRFVGHKKDVLSVAFSADNRQIVSGSRDRTVALWNTLGQMKYQLVEDQHTDWVSCVRFSPNPDTAVIVSAGWDKLVKIWDFKSLKLRVSLRGHSGYVNTVAVSPDGSLCASGGKDGVAMLWDLNEGRHLSSLESGDVINSLVFSPNRYWLCAATASGIKIWDLESKKLLAELQPLTQNKGKKSLPIQCTSICFSPDGFTLYSGHSDNIIRIWDIRDVDRQ